MCIHVYVYICIYKEITTFKIQSTLDSKASPLELTHTENKQNKLLNKSVHMFKQQLKMRCTIYNPGFESICVLNGSSLRQLIFFPTYYN